MRLLLHYSIFRKVTNFQPRCGRYLSLGWLCGLFLVFSCSVFAGEGQQAIRLFSKTSYPLNSHMQILEDPTNLLTIDDIASPEYLDEFYQSDQSILNLSITQSTFWVKVKLLYPDAYPNVDKQKRWYLELGRANLDYAELYISEFDGVYTVKSSDMQSAYSDREIKHVNSIFIVDMYLGQEITLYAKVKSKTSIFLPVTLWSPNEFVKKVATNEFIYGLFFGGMIILLIYNLFLYVSVRDISYLYYVLYLGGITFFDLLEMGHGMIHFSDIFGGVKREYLLLVNWETAIAGLFFAKSFMSIKENHPRINIFLNLLMASSLLSFLLTSVFSYHTAAFFQLVFMTIFLPSYLGVIVYCWLKGDENSKYFFFAWISNIVGLLIFSAVTYNNIPATPLTLAATPIGIMIEAVALSFALAKRIKHEQAMALHADHQAMSNLSRYRSVFENAKEGMYTMKLSGEFVSANPAMVKIFGFNEFSSLSFHGVELSRCLFSDDDKLNELINTGKLKNDLWFERKDGEKIWANHNAKLIVNSKGRPSHIEGTVVNVTQSILKDIAIREREKEEVELDIAKASTVAKSEFLSNMSHEIRTPLTAIIGFSESLKDEKLSLREKSNAMNLVVSSSRSLLQLINDILDFSKIEANKLNVESVVVDIVDMVERIRDEHILLAESKKLQFNVVYRYPFPATVMSDPMRIAQVLQNLCSNAIKFTESGSVILSVFWDEETNRLKFEIVDSGVGMNEDILAKLFQVFDQADTSSTRQYGGAGLGLAISQRLAELMGGGITVLSKPDKGSAFTFEVAGILEEDVRWVRNGDIPSRVRKNKAMVIPKLTGTVVLAEDNIVNQKLIERVLKKTGVTVLIAKDGSEACRLCEESSPNLVLMDINMPRKNGIEATQYLRSKDYDMPIYALTAEIDRAEVDKALAAGCQGVLAKPLNTKKLFKVMEVIMPAHSHPPMGGIPKLSQGGGTLESNRIMQRFVDDLPRIQDMMIELVKNKNWAKLKDIVNQVSEAAVSFDFKTLVHHSQHLEEAIQHGKRNDIDLWFSLLLKEFLQVADNIEEKR